MRADMDGGIEAGASGLTRRAELGAQAKAHGAKRDDTSKLWRMRGKGVKLLKLHARVVKK